MKILHLLYGWRPARGGIITYVGDLVQVQRQNNQVAVMIITPDPSRFPRTFAEDGVNYFVPELPVNQLFTGDPALDYNHPVLEEKLLEAVKNIAPDVVHIHSIAGISSRLIPLCEKKGIRTVVHLHDYIVVCPRMDLFYQEQAYCHATGECCPECLGTKYKHEDYKKRLQENIANYNQATRIIGISKFSTNLLLQFGLDQKKCVILPNGIAADWFKKPAKSLGSDKLKLVHISSCAPKKGVFLLVQALKGLPQAVKDSVELEIHGARSIMQEKLTALAAGDERIRVFPPYPREAVGEILGAADLAVLPSLWWEPFGLTVLESFTMGLPVIGSRQSGMSETITHGYNGYLIDTIDVSELQGLIVKLVQDRGLLEELKQNVRKTPVKTMDGLAKELQAIYEAITF